MNRDDWQQQRELEERRRREDELLSNDPGYLKWLDELNEQVKHNEIPSESIR